MNTFPWDIFFILLAAGLFGTLAVIPYSLSMNPAALEKLKEAGSAQPGGKKMPPAPVLILISAVQGVILVGIAAFAGLLAARAVGLELPLLRAVLDGQPVQASLLALLPVTIALGLASGIALMALEAYYFMPRIPRKLSTHDSRTPFWMRVLACFYGGIVEEILLRLFMMSGLAWLIGLVWRTAEGTPTTAAFWLANIAAALLFGAGHLPATATIVKLTPMVVARALILNGIPGVAFGYLYMRYGLEAAMIAHFSLDILVHLIMPVFMRRRAAKLFPHAEAQPA